MTMETDINNTRTTYVATAAALAVVAVLVLTDLMPARAQAPQPPPLWSVKIVSPLPLPVTGSSVVSGEVAATQSGPWNVGVTGTVSVKNVDERGRTPYRVRVHCETDTGNTCFVEAPAIPAGTPRTGARQRQRAAVQRQRDSVGRSVLEKQWSRRGVAATARVLQWHSQELRGQRTGPGVRRSGGRADFPGVVLGRPGERDRLLGRVPDRSERVGFAHVIRLVHATWIETRRIERLYRRVRHEKNRAERG